jgi:endo-1,4-beta-xylanase
MPLPSVRSLRDLGGAAALPVGAAVAVQPLLGDARYRRTLAREFGMVTCENAMKMGPVHPAPGRWDFRGADAVMAFAARHGQQARGHTLVWHNQLPAWIEHGRWTRRALERALVRHITTLCRRYRGRIAAWDVVNEAVGDDARPRRTPWHRIIGPEAIEIAFRAARQADPFAVLFYNDYAAEAAGPKADAILRLAERLLHRRVPLHGIGLQAHLDLEALPSWAGVRRNMQRIRDLGLVMQVTEADIRIRKPVTAAKLRAQADAYRRLLDLCREAGHCTAFVTWGVGDATSWVPGFFKGYDAGLLFDRACRPKPAWRAVRALLARAR